MKITIEEAAPMTTLDLRKQWKHLYAPSAKKVELVDVPELKFVMLDGRIEPGEAPGSSPGFGEAMAALCGAAYTLKFMSKLRKEDPIDYPVMALEGLCVSLGLVVRHRPLPSARRGALLPG